MKNENENQIKHIGKKRKERKTWSLRPWTSSHFAELIPHRLFIAHFVRDGVWECMWVFACVCLCVFVLASVFVTSALWLAWQGVHLQADGWERQWEWSCSPCPPAPPAGHRAPICYRCLLRPSLPTHCVCGWDLWSWSGWSCSLQGGKSKGGQRSSPVKGLQSVCSFGTWDFGLLTCMTWGSGVTISHQLFWDRYWLPWGHCR